MATDYNNRLITPDLEKAMKDYPLYSQDSKKKDALCIAVFFIGSARWYILEGQREYDDFVLFGIIVGLAETEYGYISANEMASVALTRYNEGQHHHLRLFTENYARPRRRIAVVPKQILRLIQNILDG